MSKLEIKEISYEDWDRISLEFSGYNFFQQTKWLDLVAKEFGLKNRFFEIIFTDGKVFMCFQCKGSKAYSNFIGYGGPIFVKEVRDMNMSLVVKEIEDKFQLDINRIKLFPGQVIGLESNNFWLPKKTSILEITNDWEKRISKNARNSVNNAFKNQIDVRPINNDEIDEFYDIYEKTMNRVESSYKTPKSLFKELFLFDNVYFVGAFSENKIISASIFLNQEKWSYYWWNASSEMGREKNANYLIMYYTIKKLSEDKFKFLDMAGSNNDKILSFKRKWGANDSSFLLFSK